MGPEMLSSLAPIVRPMAGSASASATSTDAAAPAPAAPPVAPARGPEAAAGSSGGGFQGFGGNASSGAYVPPLARGGADAGGQSGRAAAAYAQHSGEDDSGSGRAETGQWMSSAVTQPNAPSFAESTREIQQADDAQKEAVMAEQRRASLDYLVASMKSAARAVGAEGSAAMRQAVSAYAEF
jgi:hypothetical protein